MYNQQGLLAYSHYSVGILYTLWLVRNSFLPSFLLHLYPTEESGNDNAVLSQINEPTNPSGDFV